MRKISAMYTTQIGRGPFDTLTMLGNAVLAQYPDITEL